MRPPNRFTVFALAAVTAYFLWFSWDALHAGVSFDDLMSIYRAERLGWTGHLRDILAFFTFSSAYRPTGTLFYLAIFEGFGFNALAFRIGFHIFLVANVWLAYALARRLTGSRESAALCIALFAYHGRYESFFTSTGFVYDLLCFTFFAAAFLYYLRSPKPNIIIWSALFILCLNAKEMGVTLPALIGAWELLQPERRKRWWLFPLVGGVITAAFIVGRLILPPEGLAGISSYTPKISLSSYLEHGRGYLDYVVYSSPWLTGTKITVMLAAVVALAVATKNVGMRFALVWMAVSVLPIAFIPLRPLASACIPMFGLTLLLGELVWSLSWRAARIVPAVTAQRWGLATLAMVLLLMTLVHRRHGLKWVGFTPEHDQIRGVTAEMRPWQPALARGSRTLILNSPFPEWMWDATFLSADLAREPGAIAKPRIDVEKLVIYEQENLHFYFPTGYKLTFDLILSRENGHVTECNAAPFKDVAIEELAKRRCEPLTRQPASASNTR